MNCVATLCLILASVAICRAKTLADVKKCFEDGEDKCDKDCGPKLADKFRKEVTECAETFFKVERASTEKCAIELGGAMTAECFAPRGITVPGGNATEKAGNATVVRAKRDLSAFPELKEAIECVETCGSGLHNKCIEGCTKVANDAELTKLRACIEKETPPENLKKFEECLKKAVGK